MLNIQGEEISALREEFVCYHVRQIWGLKFVDNHWSIFYAFHTNPFLLHPSYNFLNKMLFRHHGVGTMNLNPPPIPISHSFWWLLTPLALWRVVSIPYLLLAAAPNDNYHNSVLYVSQQEVWLAGCHLAPSWINCTKEKWKKSEEKWRTIILFLKPVDFFKHFFVNPSYHITVFELFKIWGAPF